MMEPHYADDLVTLHQGDCLAVLAEMPAASVDAVVTDPPYGLEFMGKEWDAPWKHGFGQTGYLDDAGRVPRPNFGSSRNPVCRACRKHQRGSDRCQCDTPDFDERPADSNKAFGAWCEAWARQCLRVLKPGGHLLAFGGSRTWHRLADAVEDAGFEIRDSIAWLYGSGFPKSLNVAKAIESGSGRPEDIRRMAMGEQYEPSGRGRVNYDHGGGSAMNGAIGDVELSEDARRWQGWGTALKPAFEPIVVGRKPLAGTVAANVQAHGTGALNVDACRTATSDADKAAINAKHAGMAVEEYQRAPGVSLNLSAKPIPLVAAHAHDAGRWPTNVLLDDEAADCLDEQTADASRYFPTFRYESKAPANERPHADDGTAHPTVKPVDLMRWLVRLVTPADGVVLDPFLGSGTTAEACVIEGFRCIGIEREPAYVQLAVARLSKPIEPVLFGDVPA